MSLKKFIKVNSKRLIGASLLLSLMAVQSVGAAGTISDEIVSKGNIEYDANNDGTADVYFYSKDLTAIATGIDSLNTNITTLNTAMETLKETTSGYKTDIISALNSNVYSTNNISSSATFEDIIAKINAIEKKTVSQTLNPGSSYTLAAGYYTGGTVAANANTQTYTYAANSTGGTVDLGATNLYRYVNASNVYTKGKADGVASTNATATGAQVLNGYTFWANGSKLTGTMANYSSSTGQSSTTANTSNYLYVKPSNAGYYTSASSFNTGIAYNPNKTIAESSSSATATGTGTTSATTINLDSDQKVTLPAGYYSDAQTIQNVASGGSLSEYEWLVGKQFVFNTNCGTHETDVNFTSYLQVKGLSSMNVTYSVGHVHYYKSCTIRFYNSQGASVATAITKELNGIIQDQSVTYDVPIPSICTYILITMGIGGADTGSDSQTLTINNIS